MNPGNAGWKLTAGESFYDIPDLFTGCFESSEDSIEMLLGMKKFDGMEGIGALTNEMIPSPSDLRSKEKHFTPMLTVLFSRGQCKMFLLPQMLKNMVRA